MRMKGAFPHHRAGHVDEALAPVRHRVARVDGEVHEDLLDLVRIRAHPQVALIRPHVQRHPLAQHALQHAGDILDALPDIEHRPLHHLLATEGEELPREVPSALTRAERILHRLAARAGREVLEHEAEVAVDDREQVVEVVRHAAGEPSQGLEALGVEQLFAEEPRFVLGPCALIHLGLQRRVGGPQLLGALQHLRVEVRQRVVQRAPLLLVQFGEARDHAQVPHADRDERQRDGGGGAHHRDVPQGDSPVGHRDEHGHGEGPEQRGRDRRPADGAHPGPRTDEEHADVDGVVGGPQEPHREQDVAGDEQDQPRRGGVRLLLAEATGPDQPPDAGAHGGRDDVVHRHRLADARRELDQVVDEEAEHDRRGDRGHRAQGVEGAGRRVRRYSLGCRRRVFTVCPSVRHRSLRTVRACRPLP
jgi:hypothetical protein